MVQKKPARQMNDSADTSYRVADSARVPNAEPGFDDEGRGLHHAQIDQPTGYAQAQKAPTYGYPDEHGTPRR
jgi:hypothetical protein